jgi:rhodanese-related sulfurtransferase
VRWSRLLVFIAAGFVLGLGWNAFSGRGFALTSNAYLKPGDQVIDVTEAKRRFDKHAALFLDARPRLNWQFERIPGALSLPEDDFAAAFAALEPTLRAHYDIVVYCSGFGCESSHFVARWLKERGIPAVVMQDGFPAWQGAHYPIETPASPKP